MTIDEAIKELQERADGESSNKATNYGEDILLGIEALKKIKEWRHYSNPYVKGLLSGETEE
jgi:hypothetical protein